VAPKFIYFDLGRVILDFDVDVMLRQMAAVIGVESDRVRQILFEEDLQRKYEAGSITSQQFHETFCRVAQTRPDFAALARAAGDIFTIKPEMLPIIDQLHQAGYPLGILSNTCEVHWDFCWQQFPVLRERFQVLCLSYRVGALKPSAEIFAAAAKLANARPEELFFTDDVAQHVAGARAAGWDAEQFTVAADLVEGLRRRGVHVQEGRRVNYEG
jgi:glucose-1-phosphatase